MVTKFKGGLFSVCVVCLRREFFQCCTITEPCTAHIEFRGPPLYFSVNRWCSEIEAKVSYHHIIVPLGIDMSTHFVTYIENITLMSIGKQLVL